MAVNLSPVGGGAAQFFDNSGNPLSGGKLFTYEAGTTTPQVTYTSATGATPHSNPIILDAAGRVAANEIWLINSKQYKFVIKTSADVLIGTYDNISGLNSVDAEQVAYLAPYANSVVTSVETKLSEFLSVKDFGAVGNGIADDTAAITNAIIAADNANAWLFWNKGTYRVTSSLLFNISQLRWKSEEAVVFFDTPSDVFRGIYLTLSQGVDHQLVGTGFEVNANHRCHSAIRFLQPLGTQTTNLYIEKVGARNVEMQVGRGEGSHGVSVCGGFKQVKLVDCYAENIMMRTGAGILGFGGVTGIILQNNFNVTGAYIKNMILVRPTVRRVYNQDLTYQFDMDGIGLFANPLDATYGPAYAEITSPDISNCWGRNVKMQTSACKIDAPNSLINEGPTGGIIHPAYDFQTGSGVLIGGQYTVDGVNVKQGIVGFQISSAGLPMSSKWDGGSIDIINGGQLDFVLSTAPINVVTKYVASVSNVSVKGPVKNFAVQYTNGFDIHTLKLDGIVCETITDALVKVSSFGGGTAPYRGIIYAKNCINLGANVPTVVCNIPGFGAGALLDDIGGIGFGPVDVVYASNATTLTGLSIDDAFKFSTPLNNQSNSGTEKLYSLFLTSGQEQILPSHGFNNVYLAYFLMGSNRTTFAVLSVDNLAIVSIDVGAGANIGTTADPGAGSLRIWRNTGTNQLVVKNGTASSNTILVKFFG